MKPNDEYTGSIMRFITDVLDIEAIFETIPEGMRTPSVYFPTLNLTGNSDTLSSFSQDLSWYIKIFGKDSDEAYNLAKKAVTAINRNRNKIPIVNENGEYMGKNFKIKQLEIKEIDTGVCQLIIRWTQREYYSDVFIEQEEIKNYHFQ